MALLCHNLDLSFEVLAASGGQSIFSTWDQERTYQELLVIQAQLLHNRGEREIEVDKSFVWGDRDTLSPDG